MNTRTRRLCTGALLLAAVSVQAAVGARAGAESVRFDLATGSVYGRLILGRTLPTVTSALGRPDDRSVHPRQASLRYGRLGRDGPWAVTIFFRPRAGALRAVSVAIASPSAKERRLGSLLRLTPRRMQQTIARGYGGTVELTQAYRCRRRPLRCQGTFTHVGTDMHISFGLLFPGISSKRYISMYAY
jgi:hypothetical protein